MEQYSNYGGGSNVKSYSIGDTYIKVSFNKSTKVYTNSYKSAGVENVEQMKKLARQGCGLNSFINKNVKYDYER